MFECGAASAEQDISWSGSGDFTIARRCNHCSAMLRAAWVRRLPSASQGLALTGGSGAERVGAAARVFSMSVSGVAGIAGHFVRYFLQTLQKPLPLLRCCGCC